LDRDSPIIKKGMITGVGKRTTIIMSEMKKKHKILRNV
jgi:hypothetical protein